MAFGLWLFQSFYSMCNNTAVTYFCQYELGNVNYSASLLTVENTALVIGILRARFFSSWPTSRNLAVMGTSLAIIGQVLVILSPKISPCSTQLLLSAALVSHRCPLRYSP